MLALRKKTGNKKGAILVFPGPAGTGKTSIASSIAEAMGRKFVRVSLGGVHDETVIRGHGRTYLGSMPGVIMREMKVAGTVNPVMLLARWTRSATTATPRPGGRPARGSRPQAESDLSRPVRTPYDLSEVLFIVTANELDKVPRAEKPDGKRSSSTATRRRRKSGSPKST